MRHYVNLTATLISMAVLCAPGCTGPAAESPGISKEVGDPRSERLQQIVDDLRKETGIPGLSVAIAKTGEEPLLSTTGVANVEAGIPVSADTMFFIGSVSKNVFATVALRMVDKGHLTLDTRLSRYVEWPRGDEITLRMLLNHTSGIPEYLTAERYATAGDGGLPQFFRTPHTPVELFKLLPDRTPDFDPGSAQDYSNTNGLLVGEVIRLTARKPLGNVFDEEIVRPLGLRHTYLYGEATAKHERARGYCAGERWGATEDELVDCSSADDALPDSADGSVVASARDLLRYHQALRGGELLSDDTWTAMRTVDEGIHNGLGYLIGEGKFGRYEGNIGRAMGHVAANVYYADRDTYVVMMSNWGNAPIPLAPFLERWFGEVGEQRD